MVAEFYVGRRFVTVVPFGIRALLTEGDPSRLQAISSIILANVSMFTSLAHTSDACNHFGL